MAELGAQAEDVADVAVEWPTTPTPVQVDAPPPRHCCRACGSASVTKFGFTSNNGGIRLQRYLCKDCHRTSVEGDMAVKMRYSRRVIDHALKRSAEGASLHAIRRELQAAFGVHPDHANIARWVRMSKAGRQIGLVQPQQ